MLHKKNVLVLSEEKSVRDLTIHQVRRDLRKFSSMSADLSMTF